MNIVKSNNGETAEIDGGDYLWFIDRKDTGWTRDAFLAHYKIGLAVSLMGRIISDGPVRVCRMTDGCCGN